MTTYLWVEVTQMDGDGEPVLVKMTTEQAGEAIMAAITPKQNHTVLAYVVDTTTGEMTTIRMADHDPDETKIITPEDLK